MSIMPMSLTSRRLVAALTALALLTPGLTMAAGAAPLAQIVRTAACTGNGSNVEGGEGIGELDSVPEDEAVDCNRDGLSGFVNAADALVDPAIIAMAAICPIACIIGAGALMFGNRRGMPIIGSALGALVFVISVKGIVA